MLRRAMRAPASLRFTTVLTLFLITSPSARQAPPPAPPSGPPPGPDSQVQPGTPTGEVIKGEFPESKVYPNGVLFSPDQTLLYVSDYIGQLSWAFQIQPDGSLAHKQKYFYLHVPDSATRSSADGMAADADGRVYIGTALGIQVFDQIGKCHAIIPAPQPGALSNVEFGGANMDEMYVTNGDKVFKRRTRVKRVLSWRAPIKPPAPRL